MNGAIQLYQWYCSTKVVVNWFFSFTMGMAITGHLYMLSANLTMNLRRASEGIGLWRETYKHPSKYWNFQLPKNAAVIPKCADLDSHIKCL